MHRKPTYEELFERIKELEQDAYKYQCTEKELQKSKGILKAIIDSLPFDVFALDSDNRYFLQNSICKNNWGDLIGNCPEDLPVNKETLNLWTNNNRRAFSGETVVDEVEYHNLEGKKCFYHNIIAPIINGDKIFGILGVLVDISKRKQTENALKESESKLSAMLASIGDHMSMMDKDLNILWANEIAENIFGNDIIGKKCYEVYHKRTEPCEPYPCIALRAFQNGTVHKHDTQVIDKDGTTIFYHCTANVALRDKEGKPTAVLEISKDITEKVQAEQAMKTHLNVKEMLLSEIHHRVKNNLEIIASLLDLSSMNTGDREIQKTLSDIRSRIFSMALIHTQLYENNRFDKIDMAIYVQRMLDYISDIYGDNEKPINFVIEASEMHLSLNQAIPSALALNEIITNSFKHAFRESKHGTINVCMKNISDDTVFMSVKDDGIGISKGIDFNNTKGIGLNLVKHLIENQLKGEVRVNPNDGTEFSLEFKRLIL